MIQGQLFSSYFLEEGVRETPDWIALQDNNPVFDRLREIISAFPHQTNTNEAACEDAVIIPVLELLGYHYIRQQTSSRTGRADVPDFLLFADESQRADGLNAGKRMFAHGCAILEAKRWDRPLDRGDATDPMDARVPSIKCCAIFPAPIPLRTESFVSAY